MDGSELFLPRQVSLSSHAANSVSQASSPPLLQNQGPELCSLSYIIAMSVHTMLEDIRCD